MEAFIKIIYFQYYVFKINFVSCIHVKIDKITGSDSVVEKILNSPFKRVKKM